jgi:parvulin-like peptidyl-prolyl isomerase
MGLAHALLRAASDAPHNARHARFSNAAMMKIMRLFRLLSLYAAGLCLVAQTPTKTPAQPPVPATPVVGSTPASPASAAPTPAGTDGVTMPLNISPAPVIPPDRVVIQVGDIKLTAAQMDEILQAYPENQRMVINGPGRGRFIDQVVRVLLLSAEGRRRKLTETEAYKAQLMFSTAGILATHTDDDIKREVRGNETLLKAYYEAHKSDYEQIRASHILIRMQGSPIPVSAGQLDLTEAEALAKAREIRQKIVEGADFADLARAESSDASSASKGGNLGFLKHGQAVPSFEDALFALPVGELSQPVKTTFGYHIIKVEEKKPARTFEEVRPELEKNLENKTARKFLDDLKSKTKIVIDPDFTETSTVTLGLKQ